MKTSLQVGIIALLASIALHVCLLIFLIFYMHTLPARLMKHYAMRVNPVMGLYFCTLKKNDIEKNKPHTSLRVAASLQSGHAAIQKEHSNRSTQLVAPASAENNLVALLHSAIQSQQKYPKESQMMHEEGSATVGFNLQLNGIISDVRLIQSSGIKRIDNAALDAVNNANPIVLTDEYRNFLHQNSNHFVLKVTFHLD